MNYMAIHKCKNYEQFAEDTKLLIMPDGGVDLIHFSSKMRNAGPTLHNIERMRRFWIEARRIIYAVQDLGKHKMVHHDIKMGNIVYDESENRMNLIDFGLMTTFSKIRSTSLKSKNWLSQIFWSFPFEIHFYNKKSFMEFAKTDDSEKREFVKQVQNSVLENKKDLFSDAIRTFFSDVISKNSTHQESDYFQEFEEMLIGEIIPSNYSQFVTQSLKTIDIYGLGILFMCILRQTPHLISKSQYEDFESLFFEMIRPNYTKRIHVENVLQRYDEILERNGITIVEKIFGGVK
jgi:serine/threonine protein kinase